MVPITTFDQWIVNFVNNNFSTTPLAEGEAPWGNLILCALAVILSVILCGLIGLEREKRGRSAGLRTHLLVGVGSCIVMIISIYGFPAIFSSLSNGEGSSRDVARLAAGVISGVGFLGAGAIIHSGGRIKGLTTAGTIWLVMAIGLACGSFNFILGIGSTIIILIVLVTFRGLERVMSRKTPTVVLLAPSDVPLMTLVLSTLKPFDYSASDVNSVIVKDGESQLIEMTFKIISNNGSSVDIPEIISKLEKETKAISVQVLNHH